MNLHGPVRASEAAGPGTAQVSISFDSWKDGHVLPTTHAVLVEKPRPAPKPEPVSSRLIKTLVHPDRKANVADVRFFAGGTKLFAAGYPSGVAQVFDVETGKELRRIESPRGYRGSRYYALPTPDFQTLYVSMQRRKVVAFEKDGTKQHRIEHNGELLAWDLANGKDLPSIKPTAAGRGVLNGYMSPDGTKLVTVERPSYTVGENVADETVLWDLKTRTATVLGTGFGMAGFSPDGRRMAVTLGSTKKSTSRLTMVDLHTGKALFTLNSTGKPRGFSQATFSPDGKMLAVEDSAGRIDQPGTIRLYDAEDGKELAAFDSTGKYPFMGVTFSPDGRRLAANDYNGCLTIWDLSTNKMERTYSFNGLSLGWQGAFSPDGKMLAVPAQARFDRADVGDDPDPTDLPQPRLFLFDLARGGEPELIICPHGYGGGLAFSPDGKILAFGGCGVHVFDLAKK